MRERLSGAINSCLAWAAAFFTMCAVLNPFLQVPSPVQGTTTTTSLRAVTRYVPDPTDWHSHPWLNGRAVILTTVVRPLTYTIRPGDILSAIAKRFYGTTTATWYLAQHNHIANPDLISAGKVLTLPPKRSRYPQQPAPAVTVTPAGSTPVAAARYSGSGGLEQCIIAHESGGNPQIWSPSGIYWGLYQFSAGTWASYGGAPALFGNASGSYQHGIYENVVAAGPQAVFDAWESDGCPQEFGM